MLRVRATAQRLKAVVSSDRKRLAFLNTCEYPQGLSVSLEAPHLLHFLVEDTLAIMAKRGMSYVVSKRSGLDYILVDLMIPEEGILAIKLTDD